MASIAAALAWFHPVLQLAGICRASFCWEKEHVLLELVDKEDFFLFIFLKFLSFICDSALITLWSRISLWCFFMCEICSTIYWPLGLWSESNTQIILGSVDLAKRIGSHSKWPESVSQLEGIAPSSSCRLSASLPCGCEGVNVSRARRLAKLASSWESEIVSLFLAK